MGTFKLINQVKGPGRLVCKTAYFLLDAGTSNVTAWDKERDVWRMITRQSYAYGKNTTANSETFTAYLKGYDQGLQEFLHARVFPSGSYSPGGVGANPGTLGYHEIVAFDAGSANMLYQVNIFEKTLVPAQTSIVLAQSGAGMIATTCSISWIESRDSRDILDLV